MVKTQALLALAGLLFAAPASACRLALVLAIDVSSSVDADEDRLQRAGIANALLNEDVQAAIFANPDPVALAAFEWSGQYLQTELVGWTMLHTAADVFDVANQIAKSKRARDDMPTAMGSALGHAAVQLTRAPDCLFKTIDLAGDGINNDGFGPLSAYDAFPFDGVTVNGLVVLPSDIVEAAELLTYYQSEVIRGPAAFVETAIGFDAYAAAMRRKLLRELTTRMMGAAQILPAPAG